MKAKFEIGSLLATLLLVFFSWIFPDFQEYQTLLIAPIPTKAPTTALQITVVRVIDGDTVELSTGEKVRYIGIDTPERNECFFHEAKLANEKLVLNKKVKLVKDVSQTDKYGRLLRYIYVDNVFVNNYLVKEGYAYAATYPPDVNYQELFLKSQKQARESQKGFWADNVCEDFID